MSRNSLAVETAPINGAANRSPSSKELQELWFSLARRNWTCLVLAPATPDGSAEEVARSLADVGKHLSEYPVTAICVKLLGPGSARAIAALAQHVQRNRQLTASRNPVVDVSSYPGESDAETMPGPGEAFEPPLAPPAGQVIISIPSIVAEPLGLAVAHVADAVVLSVDVGRTRMADARRSVELIGRERVAGCFLVR